jgi:hypothetical protein
MATYEYRISEFNQGEPPAEAMLQLLCEDHNGTYTLPFACIRVAGRWLNAKSRHAIECTVRGWRPWLS